MAYYLGIDGGGTKTSALLGDETRTLARAESGPSNIVRVGEDAARTALIAIIQDVCRAAQIAPSDPRRICIGASGAARPEVANAIRRIVNPLTSSDLLIVSDMETSLESAFGHHPGIIVIAGTGSIAYGRSAHGKTLRIGGWGHAISDEGSGHWIGRAAVTAALRARDEGESSLLLEKARAHFGAASDDDFIVKVNSAPDFAAFVPAVISAAETDSVARRVLTAAGAELARLAHLAAQRLFSEAGKVPVAMIGSVFRNSQIVRESFLHRLHESCPAADVRTTVVDPVEGALTLARGA